jgi:hypothetical protein
MLDVAIDLETMSTRSDAAICAIGAVAFSLTKLELGDRFYTTIDLRSCEAAGLRIDADTVTWWMKQGDAARNTLTRNTEPLTAALGGFTAFLMGCGPTSEIKVWGNGPSFDNAILANAYRAAGIPMPWKYWNDRCCRTLAGMFPTIEKQRREGTHHNALDDAIYQAQHLLHVRRTVAARKTNA